MTPEKKLRVSCFSEGCCLILKIEDLQGSLYAFICLNLDPQQGFKSIVSLKKSSSNHSIEYKMTLPGQRHSCRYWYTTAFAIASNSVTPGKQNGKREYEHCNIHGKGHYPTASIL